MHRLATVHARDNQWRHDTAYLNKRLFYSSKVRRLKNYRKHNTSLYYRGAVRIVNFRNGAVHSTSSLAPTTAFLAQWYEFLSSLAQNIEAWS